MARSPTPPSWDTAAQQLWEQGEQQAAINRVLALINRAPKAVPKQLGLQLSYYVFLLGDLRGAEQFLGQLQTMHPNDADILENLAVVISRQAGRGDEALPLFRLVCELRPDCANAWDGLAKELARSHQYQQAQQAGERSLALKTAATVPLANWAPPAGTPQDFLQRPGQAKRIDFISFSIWGSNPRYLRGALRNALLIPELYPGWQARFHLDDSVPSDFVALLRDLGAAVQLMPAGQSLRQKLCWRFQVANDPGVGRFLVRDCDSVVNQREVRAVQQWLESDRWFHVMRDWWTHTDPILAGMWGGIAGVLPDLAALLSAYKPPAKETANVDQWFLRDVLWGSIRHLALIHDRCYRSEGSQPWPNPNPSGDLHVGQDEFAAQRAQQTAWLRPWIRRTPYLQLADDVKAPAGLTPLHKTRPDDIHLCWPGPLPEEPPPMPKGVSGRIINLECATARWLAMEAQLQALGWEQSHRRQPALTGSDDEAKSLGLRNGGELGLWRTTRALVETWLAEQPAPSDVLHVLEDDAILHPHLSVLINVLREGNPPLDLLFSEAFLSTTLYRRLRTLELERVNTGNAVLLLNGGQYLACTSSYLLSRDGAQRLLNAMRDWEATGKLVPIDMAYRRWIREGLLRASVSLPFFSTISAGTPSTLQHDRPGCVHFSQNADLSLRRLLFRQTWDPTGCSAVLQELSGLLGSNLTPEQIETLVLEILETGRSEGWLARY
jgi:hypothetical protein